MEGKERFAERDCIVNQAGDPARGVQGGKAAVHEFLPSVPVRGESQEGHHLSLIHI